MLSSIWYATHPHMMLVHRVSVVHRYVSVAVLWKNMGCCEATLQPFGCFLDELLTVFHCQ